MTKQVRIENADTSQFKVKVYVEHLIDGQWVRQTETNDLPYPTSMAQNYLTSDRRLVVEEYQ